MSRIYFESQTDTTEVWGGERAWLSHVAARLGSAMVERGRVGPGPHPMARVLDKNHHYYPAVADMPDFSRGDAADRQRRQESAVGLLLSSLMIDDADVTFDGETHHLPDLVANTAITLGPIPALMAKIHFTCEVHGWVDERNRDWFADLIQQGLDAHMLRDKVGGRDTWSSIGWPELIEHLRRPADGPVVMSYSVTDDFTSRPPDDWGPNIEQRDAASRDWLAALVQQAWDDLALDGRWRICVDDLRKNHAWLEISPASLQGQMFSQAKTLWDMMASPEWMGADARVSG